MDIRELPVLSDEDGDLIDRLATGLGDDAARVLAYLLRRREIDQFGCDPATRLAMRIGTSLNRKTADNALNQLEKRNLITATTLRNEARGRPPTAWHAPDSVEMTMRQMYKRHAAALLEQTKTVAPVLGVDQFDEEPISAPFEEPTPLERLRLGLNWHPNVLHAPFFTALETGKYDANDIKVTIDHYCGSRQAINNLLTGMADVVLAGAATMVRARDAGNPVFPVALLFQRAMAVLYTTREAFGGRFESIEQLRGRRVGMSSTSEMGVFGRLFLSQSRVVDDVELVNIVGEEQVALQSGRADIVTGSFVDPRQLQSENQTVDSLLVADQFPMYGPALVTTQQTLYEHPLTLMRFLAGTVAGWATAVNDPETAVYVGACDELVDESALDDKRRTFERAVEVFGTGTAVEKHGWGWQQAAGWERLVTALDQAELLTESVLAEPA